MTFRPWCLLAVLSALLAAFEPDVAICADGPAEAPASSEALRFRRVYGPADRLKDWLPGHVKYVPIEPPEFERLLKLIGGGALTAQAPAATQIATAEYQAQLVGDHLVAGQANLKVTHAGQTPALMPLDPCSLAVGKASWAGAKPLDAVLGLDAEGRLAALVERAGQLQFEWSLEGRREAADALAFAVAIPACPVNRCTLDVPDHLAVFCDRGLVQDLGWVDEGVRRWQIELGGQPRFRLRIAPARAAPAHPQLAVVRGEALVYDVSVRGVDVSAQLEFEVHREPLEQLTLSLDPGLQLLTARYGDALVPWSIISPAGQAETKVSLTLPEPLPEDGRVLKLTAWAPLETDRVCTLPRIRPQQVLWQEGSATVSIAAPLVAKQMTAIDGRQSGTNRLAAPRVGESAQFQYFTPDASVQVVLSRRAVPVQVRSGTAIVLSGREATARIVAEFRTPAAAGFSLEVDVAQPWQIDTIESVPPGAVNDWNYDKERPSGNRRKLHVSLSKGLSPEQPLRLVVAARRPRSPLEQKLSIDELVPLRFHASGSARRLVTVRAVDPYQLQFTGNDHLKQLDYQKLDASDAELFARPPRGPLFEDDAGAAGVQITVESRKLQYEAAIRIEATVDPAGLQEDYYLQCKPESSGLQRVLVHFSQRRETPLRWTLVGGDSESLQAQRLSAGEQTAANLDPEQESWQIALPRPFGAPFELHAVRRTPWSNGRPVSLAWLPEAANQQATLTVRAPGGDAVQIDNRRLQAVPTETAPPGQCQTLRGTYVYTPSREILAGPGPTLSLSLADAADVPAAWIWNCHLESWYESNGLGRHVARYRLQHGGNGRLHLTLPADVAPEDVRGVWLDERRISGTVPVFASAKTGLSPSVLRIELPPEKKFPTVTLEFVTPGRSLGIVGAVEPPLPQVDLNVLSQHWSVWLPPGYRSFDDDARWQPLGLPQTSWRQRLFGVLGRRPESPPFDPATFGEWFGNTAERAAQQSAAQQADGVLELLGTLAGAETAARDTNVQNWGGLLGHASIEAAAVKVLVDRHALACAGITPQTRVLTGNGSHALACGIDVLQKTGLVLLVHPDAVLLTTRQDAALLHPWLATLGHQVALCVCPGPLAEQLQEAAAAPDANLVAAKTWSQQPAEALMPWTRSSLADSHPADTLGWTAYRTEITETPVRLSFVYYRTFQFLGSVALLIVVGLGWWKGSGWPLLLVSLAGASGVLALVLPESCFPIASGALLGASFCLVLELIRRPHGVASSESATESKQKIPSTIAAAGPPATTILVLAALCLFGRTTCGADTAEKPKALPPAYEVFVPLDDKQQPARDRYFLPAEFYTQLHRQAALVAKKPQAWLIGGATYRGELVREAAAGQLRIDEVKAIFDLHVLGPAARVRIPLSREGANLLPDGAELDGQSIQADWDADGKALVFDVAETGRHRLELAMRPTPYEAGTSAGFDLAIPRVANSRLELLLPGNVPNLDVPTAVGVVRQEEEPRQLVADLGPGQRLSVRWSTAATPAGNGPAVDVEELVWLKVNPGSVVVDAKLKLNVVDGQLRQLALAVDPRLRPLQVQGDDVKIVEGRALPGQPQSAVLHWTRPVTGRTVVEARFLLTGTSGVGKNLRLPQLELLDARATRRWMAVSVDPTLAHDESSDEPLETVAPAEFVAAWGKVEPPLLAFRREAGASAWSISTRPREPQTIVEQTLALSFAKEHTDLDYHAELLTSGGSHFQLQLTAPPKFTIDRLSLLEDDVERAARWSQEDDGRSTRITVFLSGPVAGRQALSLSGRVQSSPRRSTVLPWIAIERAQVRTAILHLYRQPAVRLKPLHGPGLVDWQEPPAEARPPQWGRLLQSLRVEGGQPPKTALNVNLNQPKVNVEQVTWLYRGAESWNAQIECRLVVSGGVLDELRFDAPDALAGPYQVSPPATVTVIDTPDDRRQLIVRPAAALDGEVHLRLGSSVTIAAGERVVVPRVTIIDLKDVKRFVALAKEVQGQVVAWETQGFSPSTLPEGLVPPAEAGPSLIYEVTDEPSQAVMRTPEHAGGVARVHLADVHVAWQSDGSYRGAVAFDLEPGRLSECPLWMPQGACLLQVTVADVPVSPLSDGADAWRIPLGAARLPQRVEVTYAGTLPPGVSAARRRFDAPMPGNLPVLQTLWTVAGPESFEAGVLEGGETSPAWSGELARLKSAATMLQLSAAFGDDDPRKSSRSYLPWARRLSAAQRGVERELPPAARTAPMRAAAVEAQTIAQEQRQLAERLGTTDLLARAAAEATVADKPYELAVCGLHREQTVARYAFPEGVGSLTLECRRVEHGGLAQRWLLAIGLAVAVLLAVIGVRRPRFRWWLKKWPASVGVGLGLAWWLWLWPSALGWGIVLLSLVAALWPTWRTAPPPPPSSVLSLRTLQR